MVPHRAAHHTFPTMNVPKTCDIIHLATLYERLNLVINEKDIVLVYQLLFGMLKKMVPDV